MFTTRLFSSKKNAEIFAISILAHSMRALITLVKGDIRDTLIDAVLEPTRAAADKYKLAEFRPDRHRPVQINRESSTPRQI